MTQFRATPLRFFRASRTSLTTPLTRCWPQSFRPTPNGNGEAQLCSQISTDWPTTQCNRTTAPIRLSGKWEQYRRRPENIGVLGLRITKFGTRRPSAGRKKPAGSGLRRDSVVKITRALTGWLTTQSNANRSPLQIPANREKYREICEIRALAATALLGCLGIAGSLAGFP